MRTLLFGLMISGSALAADRPIDKAVASFEDHTGIDLHITGDIKETDPRMPPDFGPVDPELALKVIPIIEDVLMAYPVEMRGGLLTDMYLFGTFVVRGKPFLGAAHPGTRSFDLAVRVRTPEESYRSTLHHELAHLIEGQPEFDAEGWVGVSSAYSGRLDLEPESKGVPQDEWNDKGFISRYGSKNRHEDFAEIAEVGFVRPERLKELVRDHPALRPKVVKLTDAYVRFMPGMALPWTLGDGAIYGSDGRPVPGELGGTGVVVADAGEDDAPQRRPAAPTSAPPPPPPPPPPVRRPRLRDDNGQPRFDDNGNPLR